MQESGLIFFNIQIGMSTALFNMRLLLLVYYVAITQHITLRETGAKTVRR